MNKIKDLYKFLSKKYQTLHNEYRVDMKPRYGHGNPPHKLLNEIIESQNSNYQNLLDSFKPYFKEVQSFDYNKKNDQDPFFNNGFLPGLDILTLYSLIASVQPEKYIEIGSGNSTKVVRKAIINEGLSTKIYSIDPYPRAEIDQLADYIERKPLEQLEDFNFIINELNENNILFIDNSHRSFPNSDVTVCFLEILPYLKKGVIIHIHDVYLPFDYPQFMCDRFYNEQYLLASYILANPKKYQPLFPAYYISENKNLSSLIDDFWLPINMADVERHGGSFWIQIME